MSRPRLEPSPRESLCDPGRRYNFDMAAIVGIIMGSRSDWPTMERTTETLDNLGIAHETRVISAHRAPDLLLEYVSSAAARGLRVLIAGAGGAAHLPGVCAAKTALPVIGVPIQSKALQGLDSLLSIVQMPAGVPVATVAIGNAGATNAAILAAQILALSDDKIAASLDEFRKTQTQQITDQSDKPLPWRYPER